MPAPRIRRAKTVAAVSIFRLVLSLSDNFKQTKRRGSESTVLGSNDALLTQNYNFLGGARLSLGEADRGRCYISYPNSSSPRSLANRNSKNSFSLAVFTAITNKI